MTHIRQAMPIVLAILMGCSGARKLTSTQDTPECRTTIEGKYLTKAYWTAKAPALVVKHAGDALTLYGELFGVEKNGIRFNPRREGPFYDPPEKLYSNEEIICAVDENGRIIRGSFPKKQSDIWTLELHLVSAKEATAQPLKMRLLPNQEFSYCIPPGVYRVQKILFFNQRGYIDETTESLPLIKINAADGMANYIGDLNLDSASLNEAGACMIPYKMKHRPQIADASFAFGLVGGLLAHAAASGKTGMHSLIVKVNDAHQPGTNLQLNISPLELPVQK